MSSFLPSEDRPNLSDCVPNISLPAKAVKEAHRLPFLHTIMAVHILLFFLHPLVPAGLQQFSTPPMALATRSPMDSVEFGCRHNAVLDNARHTRSTPSYCTCQERCSSVTTHSCSTVGHISSVSTCRTKSKNTCVMKQHQAHSNGTVSLFTPIHAHSFAFVFPAFPPMTQ